MAKKTIDRRLKLAEKDLRVAVQFIEDEKTIKFYRERYQQELKRYEKQQRRYL